MQNDLLGQVAFSAQYARPLVGGGGRELWDHAVSRVEAMHLKRYPQVVGETDLSGLAITSATTARRIGILIDGGNDLADADLLGGAPETVTSAGASDSPDQLAFAKLCKQLLQIGEGYALAVGDTGQLDRAVLLSQGQVQHGGNGVSSSGSESHGVRNSRVWW